MGTSCAQLLQQFYANFLLNLTIDLVMVKRYACGLDIIDYFFSKFNLDIFQAYFSIKVNR